MGTKRAPWSEAEPGVKAAPHDVGSATAASDGHIFTLASLGDADGNVDVRRRARGPATALGNPVDIAEGGAHLYVAEKANDKPLRYNGIAARSGTEDVAATLSTRRRSRSPFSSPRNDAVAAVTGSSPGQDRRSRRGCLTRAAGRFLLGLLAIAATEGGPMRARLLSILATTLALTACSDEFGEDDATSSTGTTVSSGSGASGGSGATGGEPSSGGPAGTGAGGSGGVPVDYHHDITVVDQHATPIANAPLVINGADGKVIDTGITDANGEATLEIPDGGSISAFWETPTSRTVDVVHRPPVGAPITLFVVTEEPEPPAPTDFSFYAYSSPATTVRITGYNACNEGEKNNVSVVKLTDAGCSEGATEDFLFVARSAGDSILGWLMLDDVATAPGGYSNEEIAIPAGDPIVQTELSVGGGSTDFAVGFATVSAEIPGVHFEDDDSALDVDASPLVRTFDVPELAGATYTARIGALVDSSALSSSATALTRVGPLPPSLDLDLPTATLVTLQPVDNTDAERPELTWTIAGNAPIDFSSITLRWTIEGVEYVYQARVPGDVDAFQVLEIPDELADFRPTVDAADDDSALVWWADSSAIDGYFEAVSFPAEPVFPDGTHFNGFSSQYPP